MHQILLSLFELPSVEVTTTSACEATADGTAKVTVSGNSPPYQLQWSSGETGLEEINGLSIGMYSLTVTDGNQCSQVVEFDIEAWPSNLISMHCEPQVYAPSAFSPNGDNQNDRFTLYGNGKAVEILYLQIFDRWGELVFEARNIPLNDESLGWDGTLDGQTLNPNVFPWKAVVQNEDSSTRLLNGDVVLIR
ncbi:MAG: gliding motility-associated C-terminal domain-containing protein [Saprospiraceae bacterium]|nr:gliding motility-associated C-terminal domain-containing protein [Saprospiraceae bacterium]